MFSTIQKFASRVTLFLALTSLVACGEDDGEEGSTLAEEKGYIKGVIIDPQGRPVQGADIVIDNTLIYNSNLLSKTDAAGTYRVQLSGNFTWKAYASFDKLYNGKTYTFDLHPENNEAFTSDGGIRNFQWKLMGQKAGTSSSPSYYGSTIQLRPAIGSPTLSENITFTLTPVGPLVDGSTGQTLNLKSGAPQTPGYLKLLDIPLGRYLVKATYQGRQLPLKNNITNATGTELTLDFEPEINRTGGWCENCASIEYE